MIEHEPRGHRSERDSGPLKMWASLVTRRVSEGQDIGETVRAPGSECLAYASGCLDTGSESLAHASGCLDTGSRSLAYRRVDLVSRRALAPVQLRAELRKPGLAPIGSSKSDTLPTKSTGGDVPNTKAKGSEVPGAAGLVASSTTVCVALLAVLLLPGCSMLGYTAGNPQLPNVRTIHVPTFEMEGFRRDVEYMLTEAVQKEIKTRTSYRLADANTADTVLQGRILEVRKDVLGENRFDDPRELQLTVGVEVIWLDRRTGQILNRRTITLGPEFRQQLAQAEFAPELGHSMATAMADAVKSLADQIVDLTEVSW